MASLLEHLMGGRLRDRLAGLKGRVVRVHVRLYGETGRCTSSIRLTWPSVTAATPREPHFVPARGDRDAVLTVPCHVAQRLGRRRLRPVCQGLTRVRSFF